MATAKSKTNDASGEIVINRLEVTTSTFMLLGITPMIQNRLAEKARQELLLPKGRKGTAEKATSLKHHPVEEFRASIHRLEDDDAPTLVGMPASAVKKAMAAATRDIAGVAAAQIARLVFVKGTVLPVYGLPQVMCAITRSADMARTPDVRTRAVLPQWAMMVQIEHASQLISSASLANLLVHAGRGIGLGDWRAEKGAGNYGSFTLATEDDPAVKTLLKQGRKAQEAAMADPVAHNNETAELLKWFNVELKRRGFKAAA